MPRHVRMAPPIAGQAVGFPAILSLPGFGVIELQILRLSQSIMCRARRYSSQRLARSAPSFALSPAFDQCLLDTQ